VLSWEWSGPNDPGKMADLNKRRPAMERAHEFASRAIDRIIRAVQREEAAGAYTARFTVFGHPSEAKLDRRMSRWYRAILNEVHDGWTRLRTAIRDGYDAYYSLTPLVAESLRGAPEAGMTVGTTFFDDDDYKDLWRQAGVIIHELSHMSLNAGHANNNLWGNADWSAPPISGQSCMEGYVGWQFWAPNACFDAHWWGEHTWHFAGDVERSAGYQMNRLRIAVYVWSSSNKGAPEGAPVTLFPGDPPTVPPPGVIPPQHSFHLGAPLPSVSPIGPPPLKGG
jgi:hypothetical protein